METSAPAAPLRVGVVGINSRIRRVILKGLADSPRAVVAAICRRSAEKAAAAAAELGSAEPFADYDEMLRRAQIDAIFVETPPELHHSMVLKAIAAGKHVACEKPLAISVAQATEMERAAREAGRRTAVNFTYRSMSSQRSLADLLAGGEIGELLHVRLASCPARQLFPETVRKGALEDIGPHAVDLLRWWAGAAGAGEVASVCSLESADAPDLPADLQTVWDALVRLSGGATGTLQVSRVAAGYVNGVSAEFHGRKGSLSLRFDLAEGTVSLARIGKVRPEGRWTPLQMPPEYAISYEAFPSVHLDRIVGALRGEESFPDFADGLRAQEVLEAAAISSAEGRWVRVAGTM
jgi:predicted dehydrogenase